MFDQIESEEYLADNHYQTEVEDGKRVQEPEKKKKDKYKVADSFKYGKPSLR
jgi:hypothetical protein